MAKDTEKIILEVARKQFVKNGFAGTRMQEIADEAGINKAMLHYYFRSKDKLYKEVLTATLNFLIPQIAKAIESKATFWERVENIVGVYTSALMEQTDIPIFIMSELSQKQESFVEELKKRSSYFPAAQSFIVQIYEEIEKGNIREIVPFQLFLNIIGMTVFPFIAKPIFCTMFEFSDEDFQALMMNRKEVIIDFLKHALKPD